MFCSDSPIHINRFTTTGHLQRHILGGALTLFIAVGAVQPAAANKVEATINTTNSTHNAHRKSQQRINKLDDKTREMLAEYQQVTRQTETLITYNQQLEKLVASQQQEQLSLEQQIQDIEITQQEIIPLMLRMQQTLATFISLDLPFLAEERQRRINNLQAIMDRADVSVSEKFRQTLEAYQIENDYGRTIEAYRGKLTTAQDPKIVDFLRIGRVALFYQTLDAAESGIWNNDKKQWQPLDTEYRNLLKRGLRIARKQSAPDLLVLPISTPTSVNSVE